MLIMVSSSIEGMRSQSYNWLKFKMIISGKPRLIKSTKIFSWVKHVK